MNQYEKLALEWVLPVESGAEVPLMAALARAEWSRMGPTTLLETITQLIVLPARPAAGARGGERRQPGGRGDAEDEATVDQGFGVGGCDIFCGGAGGVHGSGYRKNGDNCHNFPGNHDARVMIGCAERNTPTGVAPSASIVVGRRYVRDIRNSST